MMWSFRRRVFVALAIGTGVILGATMGLAVSRARADAPDTVFGKWATEKGKSHIVINRCDAGLCGDIAWLLEPETKEGKPKVDANNPDESLRGRPIIGVRLLSGFKQQGPAEWTDGAIYNPEDGKTYKSKLRLRTANELEVRGCVLFICSGQTWTRVE